MKNRILHSSTPEENIEFMNDLRYYTLEYYPPQYHGENGEVDFDIDSSYIFQYFDGRWYNFGRVANKGTLSLEKILLQKVREGIFNDLRSLYLAGELDI